MTPRLFMEGDLVPGRLIEATREQGNYLRNVLRLGVGAEALLFNGRDGEWRARLERADRKACLIGVLEQTRPQTPAPDMHYLFAPLKKARIDYMAQKATEMGAGLLQPVLTRFTAARRVKPERLRANAIEAAEQCHLLSVPEVAPLAKLETVLEGWEADRALIYCDEAAPITDPVAALAPLKQRPLAVLIGPEGGFSDEERAWLRGLDFVTPISLGPRIMRADTAAVAALALAGAIAGDWQE
ncbi:MAG: 16S rRNA (uracil(1498)-N(3))-methyltransferase [Hyphomicrobiales bacterium]|nr:MAG: 16S rRNA (uracil(1498)-N(3))-methyltransferase [Hyphomicrobiales bacterium]